MKVRVTPIVAPVAMAFLLTGCGDSSEARQAAAAEEASRSSEPTTPTPPPPAEPAAGATVVPEQDPEVPARWDDDMSVSMAVGQGGHLKALTAGKPFTVADSVTGTTRKLSLPQTVPGVDSAPVAWPVAPGHGFVPARCKDEDSGEAIVLHFELVWDPAETRMDGGKGMFEAVGYELAEVGDDVRHRYEQQGEFWVRSSGS